MNKINYFLNFPTYNLQIKYPFKNEKYYNDNNASKLFFKEIVEKYKGYCPYCGERITTRSSSYDREHLIEKKQNNIKLMYLIHCKYNLCISCKKCNGLKKNNLKYINETFQNEEFYSEYCQNNNCSTACDFYKKVYQDYILKNKVILQPHGVYNRYTKNILKISYNIKEKIFLPDNSINYNEEELNIINAHIKKFCLNIPDKKPIALNRIVNICYLFLTNNKKAIEKKSDILLEDETKQDNILDLIFIDYLFTLNFTQQYILVRELYYEYKKFG